MAKKSKSPNATIGQVIREARKAKGLSQNDLAMLMGYETAQFVSDWERGQAPIPMKRLTEIAGHLDLDRDRLFDLFLQFSMTRLEDELRKEYRGLRKR